MLTLICGLPNAGKTTNSQRFPNTIHSDDCKSMDEVLALVSENDGDVCVEGMFFNRLSRKRLLGSYNGSGTKCILIDTPLDICLEREDRGRLLPMIRNCADMFEPPTYDEGWDEIEVIR